MNVFYIPGCDNAAQPFFQNSSMATGIAAKKFPLA